MNKALLVLLFYSASLHARYYSQFGQDKYLNEALFHNKRNGIFIDIGAHDGITLSNTYFFEKRAWLEWFMHRTNA